MKKNRRGTSNSAMRGYLMIRAMTNAAIINDIDFATKALIKQYNVPHDRALTVARNFQSRQHSKGK